MPKSLAEIRASKHVGRPERTYPICIAGRLVAEMAALDQKLVEAIESERGKPVRAGASSQAKKIAQQADALRDEMAEHTIPILLRSRPNGDWRRWCREHPAREDEDRDKLFGLAVCNSDDLVADLGRYVVTIGEDEPQNGDWEFVAENASAGDLFGMARLVMGMHESAVDLPKSRLAFLRDQTREHDSE